MITVVHGIIVRIMDSTSNCVEVKPICPFCCKPEESSWNYEHCFAPEQNNYGYKKTCNHICSSCRKSFQIELYNY